MAAAAAGLSAPEAMVLLALPRFDPRKAIKVGLFALLLQGVLRMEVEQRSGWLRKRQFVRLLVTPAAPATLPPVAASLVAVVRAAPDGAMAEIVKQAARAYGRTLVGFVQGCVGPALVQQGLAEARRTRLLGLIPLTRYYPTPAGDAEKARLARAMREARAIPAFLQSDPAQAAALAAAAGSAILLIDELKPHYQALSKAMRPPDGGDGYSGSFEFRHAGTNDSSAPDRLDGAAAIDLSACDFSLFDSFDAGFDAFDASFDSACDGGGDGGGDGGSSGC